MQYIVHPPGFKGFGLIGKRYERFVSFGSEIFKLNLKSSTVTTVQLYSNKSKN